MVFSVLVALSLVTIAAGNGTRCYECADIPDPGDCNTVTECAPGQICAVNQFITTGGLLLFSSGCESTQRCSQKKRETNSISKRGDIATCSSCCQGDFCNDEGCGSKALKQPQRGPLCFSCNFENNPKQCRTIAKCDFGQTCMLTEIPQKSPDGHTLYKTMCQTPLVCQRFALIGRKRYKYCHVCCTDDYCNDRCELEATTTAPPPPQPSTTASTTTTTTMNVPTTTTTTTTSTTTLPTTTRSSTTTTLPTTITSTTTTTLPTTTTTRTTTTLPTTTTTTTTTTVPTTKTTTTHIPSTTRNPHAFCVSHHGYRYDVNSHLCFKFHFDHPKDWAAAHSDCKTEGGSLAIVDTVQKWDCLRDAIVHDPNYDHTESIFIGAKTDGNNRFKWTNGQTVKFENWADGQPDGHGGGEHCISLNKDDHFKWIDKPCYLTDFYICSIHV